MRKLNSTFYTKRDGIAQFVLNVLEHRLVWTCMNVRGRGEGGTEGGVREGERDGWRGEGWKEW